MTPSGTEGQPVFFNVQCDGTVASTGQDARNLGVDFSETIELRMTFEQRLTKAFFLTADSCQTNNYTLPITLS